SHFLCILCKGLKSLPSFNQARYPHSVNFVRFWMSITFSGKNDMCHVITQERDIAKSNFLNEKRGHEGPHFK
ncbi:hypothetical protein ABEB36_015168, partial [Hypothenemus hampei]